MAANDKPLNVIGVFEATLINSNRDSTVQRVYVVKNITDYTMAACCYVGH